MMIYSGLAVGRLEDGTLICTTCMADIDLATGKCSHAQAIDDYLSQAVAAALDHAIEQTRDAAALTKPQRYWPD